MCKKLITTKGYSITYHTFIFDFLRFGNKCNKVIIFVSIITFIVILMLKKKIYANEFVSSLHFYKCR